MTLPGSMRMISGRRVDILVTCDLDVIEKVLIFDEETGAAVELDSLNGWEKCQVLAEADRMRLDAREILFEE